jgi:thiol-disulfide isomerase/thioredoxin
MKLIYCLMIFLWPFVSTEQTVKTGIRNPIFAFLSTNFFIRKLRFMKYIIALVAMLLPMLSGAQSLTVKAFHIGDTVPDITINNIINYKTTSAKLSDFKGKLVILDFWASWCTTCLNEMPKSDSLQKRFKDRIQIILVNPKLSRDSSFQVNRSLQRIKQKTGISISLPIVLYDTILYNHFPFNYLPNLVWIGPYGTVKAITGKEGLIYKNIDEILEGKQPGLKLKVR